MRRRRRRRRRRGEEERRGGGGGGAGGAATKTKTPQHNVGKKTGWLESKLPLLVAGHLVLPSPNQGYTPESGESYPQ